MITKEQLTEAHKTAMLAVQQKYGSLDDKGGCCGFAWVNVYHIRKNEDKVPLAAAGFKRNDYEKCQQLWVSGFGQSIDMKETYAYAYAVVLKNLGFTAYAGSRMD
jgi:hypothetical protein